MCVCVERRFLYIFLLMCNNISVNVFREQLYSIDVSFRLLAARLALYI